jgi:hypothetical protein
MKKCVVVAFAFGLLVNVSGCGSSPDSIMKDSIAAMNDLADAVEKKDEGKAKAAATKLQDLEKKLDALKLSEDDKKKLLEKHKDEAGKALTKLMGAMVKNPEFMQKIDYKPKQ